MARTCHGLHLRSSSQVKHMRAHSSTSPLLRSSSRVTAEEIGWRKAVVRRGREVVRRSCHREEPLVLTNNIEVIHNLAKLQNGLTRKYHPDQRRLQTQNVPARQTVQKIPSE